MGAEEKLENQKNHKADEANLSGNQTAKEQKPLVCVKCLGKIPPGEEFCPHCKCPALWSQPEFRAQRQEQPATPLHHYEEASTPPQPGKRRKDHTKLWLLLAAMLLVAAGVFYLLDQKAQQPTAEEAAAIALVQQSHVLSETQTIGEIMEEMKQNSPDFVRVIGWQAQLMEPNLYLVTFQVDDDYVDANGILQYLFEADLSTQRVVADQEALQEKYMTSSE